MKLSLSTYLKAFATVTIIGPWAMFVMSGVLFGGFVPMMGLGHPMVLVGLAWVYCSGLVLWSSSANRFHRLGILPGFLFLNWLIYQKAPEVTFDGQLGFKNELLSLRDVLGLYLVLGAWFLSVILMLPRKWARLTIS